MLNPLSNGCTCQDGYSLNSQSQCQIPSQTPTASLLDFDIISINIKEDEVLGVNTLVLQQDTANNDEPCLLNQTRVDGQCVCD